ncbi:MAG: aminotransferase class I/II-fold pyridoxal phosphate-dependent enzyme [Acidobacteria bacterium]|nr:aminotransferase class I/II-fold pyridoxal phosphate-dependent enzyme [Acidobacteriota bacterium]
MTNSKTATAAVPTLDPADIFTKAYNFEQADDLRNAGLFPYFQPLGGQIGNEVNVNGNRMVMVCSNDYLGLSQDRRVQQAGIPALEEFGTSCTGSRFLNGTLSLHEGLERDLAKYLNKEDALTFSTGFLGSLGVLSALVGRREIMYFDRENHASLYDGARLSWGELRKFRHGDLEHLEFLLKKDADKAVGKLIVTDGVFSMSGEVADLPGIIELARKYGARVLVDDAHSTGVMGPNGRGTAEHFGVEDEVDLIIGTFSKAFASVGGFLAGPADVVDYVKCMARPFIFTAALPPAQVASTHESLRILSSEPDHRERLWKRVALFREGLSALGFDTMKSEGPIVPVLIGDFDHALGFWKQVWDHGVFALPAVPPAVPPGECLIRMAVNASHTREEIDRVLAVFAEVGRATRMIP